MAIAFDTALTGYVGSATSKTLSLTLSASSTLLVGFAMTTNAGFTVSSVTWAGGASFSSTSIGPATTGSFKQYAYYLASPTTGTQNMVFTISGTGEIYCAGLSYTGTGTTQFDASAINTTSLSQTITVATANSWTICSALADGGSLAASTNSTTRSTIQNTAWGVFDSNAAVAAGSYTMTQTGAGANKGGVIVSIKEPGGAAATPSTLMLLGIGI